MTRMSTLFIAIKHSIEVLTVEIRQVKEIKRIKLGMDEVKYGY